MVVLDDLLNTIVCMDAIELLRMLPANSIDMVLCDLPYGVTACAWDTVIPIEPMWAELKRVVKQRAAIVLTATQPFTSRLVSSNYEMFRYEWIWRKAIATGFLDAKRKPLGEHEDILIFSKKRTNYYPQMSSGAAYSTNPKVPPTGIYHNHYRVPTINLGDRYPRTIVEFENDRGLHPTQKPAALFEYLIRTYTVENDIVLDMTCGSGTTAIAARKTGRRFICGDLSPEYVALAQNRLQNTDPFQDTILPDGSKQLSLFREGDST